MSKNTNKQPKKQTNKVKSYQEINDEIKHNKELSQRQPTLEPQDFDEIEY